jgi:hypothetical protein
MVSLETMTMNRVDHGIDIPHVRKREDNGIFHGRQQFLDNIDLSRGAANA